LKSSDGGISWRIVYRTDTVLNGLYFGSRDQGWVVGQKGTLLTTFDGGVSWNRVELGTEADLLAVGSISASMIAVAGGKGTLLVSDVQGTTWVHCSVPTTVDLVDVSTLQSGLALVLARDRLLSSRDPCNNWTTYGPYRWTLNGLAFEDENTGYLKPNSLNSLLLTNDGGRTVNLVTFLPQEPEHPMRVRITPSGATFVLMMNTDTGSTVNIVGRPLPSHSTIFRKTTSAAWQPVLRIQDAQTNAAALEDLYFLDDLRGWAVGGGGAEFITTNGGDDWQRIQVDVAP